MMKNSSPARPVISTLLFDFLRCSPGCPLALPELSSPAGAQKKARAGIGSRRRRADRHPAAAGRPGGPGKRAGPAGRCRTRQRRITPRSPSSDVTRRQMSRAPRPRRRSRHRRSPSPSVNQRPRPSAGRPPDQAREQRNRSSSSISAASSSCSEISSRALVTRRSSRNRSSCRSLIERGPERVLDVAELHELGVKVVKQGRHRTS